MSARQRVEDAVEALTDALADERLADELGELARREVVAALTHASRASALAEAMAEGFLREPSRASRRPA